jgi:hypothetical protein
MELFSSLFDDSGLITAGSRSVTEVAVGHQQLIASHGTAVGSLLVLDRQAAELDRCLDSGLAVTVINTSGAGGLTSLAKRSFTHLRTVAVDSPLRDPGDLAGNIGRVASAGRELDPEITVYTSIPYGFGWQHAVAEAEAEGLFGLIDLDSPTGPPAELISTFVEADLRFAAMLPGTGSTPGVLGLICAVDAVIDNAPADGAEALLASSDLHRLADSIRGWDHDRAARVRRRLAAVRCPDLAAVLDQLCDLGLISAI